MAWITVEMMEECNSNTIIIIFCKLSLATLFGIFLLYLPYCHTFSHYYPISTYKTVLSFFNLALCHILVLRMCLQPKVNIGNNTTCLLVSFDCAPSTNLRSIQISYHCFFGLHEPLLLTSFRHFAWSPYSHAWEIFLTPSTYAPHGEWYIWSLPYRRY